MLGIGVGGPGRLVDAAVRAGGYSGIGASSRVQRRREGVDAQSGVQHSGGCRRNWICMREVLGELIVGLVFVFLVLCAKRGSVGRSSLDSGMVSVALSPRSFRLNHFFAVSA